VVYCYLLLLLLNGYMIKQETMKAWQNLEGWIVKIIKTKRNGLHGIQRWTNCGSAFKSIVFRRSDVDKEERLKLGYIFLGYYKKARLHFGTGIHALAQRDWRLAFWQDHGFGRWKKRLRTVRKEHHDTWKFQYNNSTDWMKLRRNASTIGLNSLR